MLLLIPWLAQGQYPQKLRNLWTRPQVHVLFGNYRVSFAIRDINKALMLLRREGDSTYVRSCLLDTALNYTYEMQAGVNTEYRQPAEVLIQNVVGPYLLSAGMAEVENRKLKKLERVLVDVNRSEMGLDIFTVDFYDPDTNEMIFSGEMPKVLYRLDIGIDDW